MEREERPEDGKSGNSPSGKTGNIPPSAATTIGEGGTVVDGDLDRPRKREDGRKERREAERETDRKEKREDGKSSDPPLGRTGDELGSTATADIGS